MAAGGILLSAGRPRMIAVVQRRKDDGWVLPKGKLKSKENAVVAARREVVEETGHRVAVHEFLGAISYESGDKLKIVQFWRMASVGDTHRRPMGDIKAVKWLPLSSAVGVLSHPVERAFLAYLGEHALKQKRPGRRSAKLRSRRNDVAGLMRNNLDRSHNGLKAAKPHIESAASSRNTKFSSKKVHQEEPLPLEMHAQTSVAPSLLFKLFGRFRPSKSISRTEPGPLSVGPLNH
jgi:8-oxo-dGTP diphosphatase